MKIAAERIRQSARERGMTISALLERAGVSRTAYYSLARRASVLPGSIHALARVLEVPPSDLLEELPWQVFEARRICELEPRAAFENVWHALALLDLHPVERLNRSLTRGRTTAVHG